MLPTLTSVLFLLSLAGPGDSLSLPQPDLTTISSDGGGVPTLVSAPEADPNRPFDVLFESDTDEEDDAPTGEALVDRGWSLRAKLDRASSGDLLPTLGRIRILERSPILRC